MESIVSIQPYVPPTLDKPKKEKKAKEIKTIEEVRERLPRVNREIQCIHCRDLKTLNPDQYQSYFDYWGSIEKVEREFYCKTCDVAMKENPFKFWTFHGDNFKRLGKYLKSCFENYRKSNRNQEDLVSLQNMSLHFLHEADVREPNYEFVIVDSLPHAMKIKNIPFVGNIQLNVYDDARPIQSL